jgi:hypothetical protein
MSQESSEWERVQAEASQAFKGLIANAAVDFIRGCEAQSPFFERRPGRGPWVHGHEPKAGELAILLGQGGYRAAHVHSR